MNSLFYGGGKETRTLGNVFSILTSYVKYSLILQKYQVLFDFRIIRTYLNIIDVILLCTLTTYSVRVIM